MRIVILLIFTFLACKMESSKEQVKVSQVNKSKKTNHQIIKPENKKAKSIEKINKEGKTLLDRITVPNGFERKKYDNNLIFSYLRGLRLKKHASKVHLYDGRIKANNVYEAVIDIDVGKKDLQQCADAVMRLWAENLYEKELFNQIHFNFTNGFKCDYSKWREGYRVKVEGNKTTWVKKASPNTSYESFRDYLELVFMYAGTLSLSKELKRIPLSDIQPGDVFIWGGTPGHAVMVGDVCEHKETGEKLFLLLQSYMPAQDIHVLKNENNSELSPWYKTDFGERLNTPEWSFEKNALMRFE